MSKGRAGTKIDNESFRGVRGLCHAGGLASVSRTEQAVPIPPTGLFFISRLFRGILWAEVIFQ